MRFLTIFLLLWTSGLWGEVQVQNNALPNTQLFGMRFTEAGGEFIGKVSSINSVALQKYVTAAFEITELNIDIEGSPTQLRIYHTGTLQSSQVLPGNRTVNNPLDRINPNLTQKVNKLVFKDYPATTHARTLEFKVANKQDILDLHAQLRNRWIGATNPGLNRTLFTVP